MLDECGLDYTLHKVNLRKGEHRTPKCKAMNPFAMTPVIVDRDGPVRDHFSAGLRRLGQRRPLVGRDEGAARGAEGPGFRLRVRGKRE